MKRYPIATTCLYILMLLSVLLATLLFISTQAVGTTVSGPEAALIVGSVISVFLVCGGLLILIDIASGIWEQVEDYRKYAVQHERRVKGLDRSV